MDLDSLIESETLLESLAKGWLYFLHIGAVTIGQFYEGYVARQYDGEPDLLDKAPRKIGGPDELRRFLEEHQGEVVRWADPAMGKEVQLLWCEPDGDRWRLRWESVRAPTEVIDE